jgi:hypothetical protein
VPRESDSEQRSPPISINGGIVVSNTRYKLRRDPSLTIQTRNSIRAGALLNAPNHHPKHLRLNVSNSPPHAPSTYLAGAPAGFTAAYPALCFWLPTPDQLPGSELCPALSFGSDTRLVTLSPQLVTGAPCTYPAEAPTTFSQVAPVRLPGVLEWSANARPTADQPNEMLARELTRLAHPTPCHTSSGSLFLRAPSW